MLFAKYFVVDCIILCSLCLSFYVDPRKNSLHYDEDESYLVKAHECILHTLKSTVETLVLDTANTVFFFTIDTRVLMFIWQGNWGKHLLYSHGIAADQDSQQHLRRVQFTD